MSPSVVSLLLAACVLSVSGGPTPEGESSILAQMPAVPASVKAQLNNVGINEETLKNFQRDPQTSLLSAMSHLGKFAGTTASEAMGAIRASSSDLYQTSKNLASEHASTLNAYLDTASDAAKKMSGQTRQLLSSYPRAIGISGSLKIPALPSLPTGGYTGFGI